LHQQVRQFFIALFDEIFVDGEQRLRHLAVGRQRQRFPNRPARFRAGTRDAHQKPTSPPQGKESFSDVPNESPGLRWAG
jgi:hypothetical protein